MLIKLLCKNTFFFYFRTIGRWVGEVGKKRGLLFFFVFFFLLGSSGGGGLLGSLGLALKGGLLLLAALAILVDFTVGDDAVDDGLGSDRVLGVVNLDVDAAVLGKLVRVLTVLVVEGGGVAVRNNVDLVNLLQNLLGHTVRGADHNLIDVLRTSRGYKKHIDEYFDGKWP